MLRKRKYQNQLKTCNNYLTTSQIRAHLKYLQVSLPHPPTRYSHPFTLGTTIKRKQKLATLNPKIIQNIADQFSLHLGLTRSVQCLINQDGNFKNIDRDSGHSSIAGFYRVDTIGRTSITIYPDPKYQVIHLLAILAHDLTHNYLHEHSLREDNQETNEILTEIACIYLGSATSFWKDIGP